MRAVHPEEGMSLVFGVVHVPVMVQYTTISLDLGQQGHRLYPVCVLLSSD